MPGVLKELGNTSELSWSLHQDSVLVLLCYSMEVFLLLGLVPGEMPSIPWKKKQKGKVSSRVFYS